MERTLIILKPDAVQRQLVGEIVTRFEKVGLKIIGCKMVEPDKEHYHYHYEDISQMISRRGQAAFDVTLEAMQLGPVIVMVLEGIDSVSLVRKMVGTTEPKEAAPGTVRGDFAHISFSYANGNNVAIPNLIHASGDNNEAEQEISHWFKKGELFSYNTAHQNFTQVTKNKK
jgi:nucleoside-diphosphate kinase